MCCTIFLLHLEHTAKYLKLHLKFYFSDNLQEINCGKYFAAVYLIIGTVGSKLDDIEEEIDDDDEDGFNEEEKKPVILLNVLDNPENLFADLLYEQEVCQTYLETFKNVSVSK